MTSLELAEQLAETISEEVEKLPLDEAIFVTEALIGELRTSLVGLHYDRSKRDH